jgi:chromosomal replication initiator protein
MRKRVPQQTFDTWFAPMKPVSLTDENHLLQVPNKFFYDWVDSQYRDMILKALNEVTGNGFSVSYTIVLGEDQENNIQHPAIGYRDQSASQINADVKTGMFEQGTRLNERYVFDTYVEGASNQFARAAAMAVASAPEEPPLIHWLFTVAPVWVKTHLLQAIGNEALGAGRAKKVVYVSSDTFTWILLRRCKRIKRPNFHVIIAALTCYCWTTSCFFRTRNRPRNNSSTFSTISINIISKLFLPPTSPPWNCVACRSACCRAFNPA